MQQQPSQDPVNPNNELLQHPPYSQLERPFVPPSQPLPPQAPMQQAPNYNPAMPGNPWPQQQQAYQPQPMYQQPMPAPPNYNPAMPGNALPQQQMYPAQPMYPPPMPAPVQVSAVNVNVNTQQGNNGCVRALYFVFVGWWLGFWCLQLGFLLCAFIITLPLGLVILNRIPQIMTLKPMTKTVQTNVNVTSVQAGGMAVNTVNVNVNVTNVQQHPFLLRALYYIFVGCWAGYLWANLAYLLCLTLVGLPLGIVMLNYLPVVLTLRKN